MPEVSPDVPDRPANAPRAPAVVIVEDDAALLGALRFSLEAEGYGVRPFLGANQMLDQSSRIMDAACIVLDYHLTPLDGLELLEVLQARGLRAPAILMTTHPDLRCRGQARRLGARIVEKPLLNDSLSRAIQELLAARNLA